MPTPTLILHGWSDTSESFAPLAKTLQQLGVCGTDDVYFGDYESREDHMSLDDAADGLQQQLAAAGLIDRKGRGPALNAVVHSTGGLVIRHWIHRHYLQNGEIDRCPLKRLLMLAPANFGSPLAHHGKGLAGRLFKGRWEFANFLESGRCYLEALELGSPYLHWLAHRDLFDPPAPVYGPDRIRCTVLCGADDYDYALKWANKPGSDGTVVIAGTPLNSVKFTLDFTRPEEDVAYQPVTCHAGQVPESLAFGVLPGFNHGTIHTGLHLNAKEPENVVLREFVRRALSVNAGSFDRLRDDLASATDDTYGSRRGSARPAYQQFLVRAVDDHDQPIVDFHLEFSVRKARKLEMDGHLVRRRAEDNPSRAEELFSERIENEIAGHFHTHSQDASHRSFLVDYTLVNHLLDEAEDAIGEPIALCLRLYVPEIDRGIFYRNEDIRTLVLQRTDKQPSTTFLYPNTTTLLELRVNRDNFYVSVGKTALKRRAWETQMRRTRRRRVRGARGRR